MTASEAAALVGVSVATIRGWADAGVIPAHRTIGGHRRFEVSELKAWLTERGAPVAERLRPPREQGVTVPRCPTLARELNARTEAILDNVEDGYRDAIPLRIARSTQASLRRSVLRYLRIATHALDSGSLSSSVGRAELAGVRAGLQGEGGLGVVIDFGRFAVAVTRETDSLIAAGASVEEDAMPVLLSVLDSMHASVLAGLLSSHDDADVEADDRAPEA